MTERHFSFLGAKHVAHRGLFENSTTAEENTLPAVSAAVEAGFGVEIDVRMTADEQVVVFHDDNLDRVAGVEGKVSEMTYRDLQAHMIGESGRPMPLLHEVLDEIDAREALFIEVKSKREDDPSRLCAGVRRAMEGYAGDVAVMSFDPRVTQWFKTVAPKIARGLVIGEEALGSTKARLLLKFAVSKSKPDFLACDIRQLPNKFCTTWRKGGKPLLTWTVRTADQEVTGKAHTDALIFEKPAVVSQ